MDKPRKRRKTTISDDPVAVAIKLWWDEQEGPHNMPLVSGFSSARKLADHLRSMGFIKNEFTVKDTEAEG